MSTTVKLTDVATGTPRKPRQWSNSTQAYSDLDPRQVFLDRLRDDGLTIRHTELGDADMYHRNLLEYLEKCWADHLGIVMTPDILWFTVLTELVGIVKESPETYRHLFTDSHAKKDVEVVSSDLVVMPITHLVQAIRTHVPIDAVQFMPEFSTTTNAARHARYASFCDLCSPYYNYTMMMCAFPAIEVQGTKDDWCYMADRWRNLSRVLGAASVWTSRVQEVFDACAARISDAAWWRAMFKLERCGSGHQTEVSGWIADLFYTGASGRAYVGNFPTHVAKVEYRQLETRRDYVMQDGLFFSRCEGDFMVPEFGFTVHEKHG